MWFGEAGPSAEHCKAPNPLIFYRTAQEKSREGQAELPLTGEGRLGPRQHSRAPEQQEPNTSQAESSGV